MLHNHVISHMRHSGDELCELVHYGRTLGLNNEYASGHLELVGVKVISKLTSFQAKELTQYEVNNAFFSPEIFIFVLFFYISLLKLILTRLSTMFIAHIILVLPSSTLVLYFSQKQLPRKMESHLVIVVCAGYTF